MSDDLTTWRASLTVGSEAYLSYVTNRLHHFVDHVRILNFDLSSGRVRLKNLAPNRAGDAPCWRPLADLYPTYNKAFSWRGFPTHKPKFVRQATWDAIWTGHRQRLETDHARTLSQAAQAADPA